MSDAEAAVPGDRTIELWQSVTEGFGHASSSISRAVEELGLPDLWCTALVRLLRTEGHRLPMSKLAQQLSVTSGGFTKMADRMAREGLIDRRNASVDRRVVHAALTPKGESLAKRAAVLYADAIEAHVSRPLGRDGVDQLARLMSVLLEDSQDAVAVQHEPGFVTTPHDSSEGERRSRF